MDPRNNDFEEGKTKKCPYCYESIHADALKCRYCRSTLGPEQLHQEKQQEHPEKMLLGVCSNLAAKYLIPVTVVRLAFVLLSLFHGFGILLYLVLWAVLPDRIEKEARVSSWFRAAGRIFNVLKTAIRTEYGGAKNNPPAGNESGGVKGANLSESR